MSITENNINIPLLLQLKAGDPAAFEELYWKYNARLYNFVLSILYDKSLAEDITQTCFLRIWEKREDIDPDKGFSAYIYTIARNLVYKETERVVLESKFISLSQEKNTEINNDTVEKLDASFIESYIDEIIDQLPPSRKEIFILSRKHGLSNKEISLRLSLSEKTVETQIYRSLQYLKEKLKGHIIFLTLLFFAQNT